jgi:hypothetical protein
LFPEFAGYARRVPKLIPRAPSQGSRKPFRFGLYRRNREYEAGLGFLLGIALLLWKALASR